MVFDIRKVIGFGAACLPAAVPELDRWAAEGRLTDDDFGRILDT